MSAYNPGAHSLTMYRRILVAVDGSKASQLALRHGIQLAKEQQARLRIVHVVDELALNVETPRELKDFWNAIRKGGERVLEKARAHTVKAGIEPETKLLEIRAMGGLVKLVADFVVKEAERWHADLIVIGTHGRRALRRLLLGSVAEGVIRISAIPVLLVRGAGRKPRPDRSRSA